MLAGIDLYSTKFEGIGGHIKDKNEDFEVTEILHNSVFEKFSKIKTKKARFPLYVLEKTGLDSNHALIENPKSSEGYICDYLALRILKQCRYSILQVSKIPYKMLSQDTRS